MILHTNRTQKHEKQYHTSIHQSPIGKLIRLLRKLLRSNQLHSIISQHNSQYRQSSHIQKYIKTRKVVHHIESTLKHSIIIFNTPFIIRVSQLPSKSHNSNNSNQESTQNSNQIHDTHNLLHTTLRSIITHQSSNTMLNQVSKSQITKQFSKYAKIYNLIIIHITLISITEFCKLIHLSITQNNVNWYHYKQNQSKKSHSSYKILYRGDT